MGRLKASELAGLASKKHHDGEGLYFDKKKRGASWIYKFQLNGRSREMGLGKYPDVPLSKARELAAKARGMKAEGKDPVAERTAVRRKGVSFEEAAREYWSVHCQHYAKPSNWIRGMEINVFPHIGKKAVADLTPDDLIKFLRPIWGQEKTRKLRQWITAVIGYVSVDDPRIDRELVKRVDNRLGKQGIEYENLPSVPWQNIPDLWLSLRPTLVGVSTKLLILSNLRVNCVVLAKWDDLDFKEKVWTIPAGRIKHWKFVYRVPLTSEMIEQLRIAGRMWGRDGYVFPSEGSQSGHLSNNAHRLWLHKNKWKDADGRLAAAHGLRTSFRNWSDDALRLDFMLAEHILQHMKGRGDKTERAYLRTDKLERRREVLEEWSQYVTSGLRQQQEHEHRLAGLQKVVDHDGRTLEEVMQSSRGDYLDDEKTGMSPREATVWSRDDGLD